MPHLVKVAPGASHAPGMAREGRKGEPMEYSIYWLGLNSAIGERRWRELLQEFGVSVLREDLTPDYEESAYGSVWLSRRLSNEEMQEIRQQCLSYLYEFELVE